MMTRSDQSWRGTAPGGRRSALLLVLLAHVGGLLWVQAARTVRLAHPVEQWIDLMPLAESGRQTGLPARPAASDQAVAARRTGAEAPRRRAAAETTRTPTVAPAPAAPSADRSATAAPAAANPFTPAVPGPTDPGARAPAAAPTDAAPSAVGLAARAVAAAGAADRAERNGKAAPLSAAPSQRQKLAAAIDAATAGPRLWQAPRITQLKDNTGYGRQIYKVETGLTTYCLVVESNHALDGRDVIRDGINKKTVSCPIEF